MTTTVADPQKSKLKHDFDMALVRFGVLRTSGLIGKKRVDGFYAQLKTISTVEDARRVLASQSGCTHQALAERLENSADLLRAAFTRQINATSRFHAARTDNNVVRQAFHFGG